MSGPTATLVRYLLVSLVAFGAISCAIKRVRTQVDLPPKAESMREAQKVAVLDFDGAHRYRGGATRKLKTSISQGPTHSLVALEDEARLQALERKLANNEVVGEIGSQGPDTLLGGEVLSPAYDKRIDKSTNEECVERDDEGECIDHEEVTTYEVVERCAVDVHVRAVDVTESEVIFEKTVGEVETARRSSEGSVPYAVGETLCDDAFGRAVDEVVPWLTAVRRTRTLKFHNVKDSGGTDKAIEAVESGQTERAGKILEQVVGEPNLNERHRGWARYNLGLLYFARSHFEKCIEQVDMGLRHLPGKNRLMRLKSECRLYAD